MHFSLDMFCYVCRYAGGTTPWGNPNASGFEQQRHDDGFLEVVGFTYTSLVRLLVFEFGHSGSLVLMLVFCIA